MRPSTRAPDQMRAVSLTPGFSRHAEGSCLVKFGDTHVLVTASLEEKAPPFLKGSGKGWVTAEYGMLPRSTHDRMRREAAAGKQSGRTQEIQRLVGRSLRAICDLSAMGERQITIDCDVLQADGGTRTASITGAWIALHDALSRQVAAGAIKANPITDHLAAVSVGIIDGEARLDLPYSEDSRADVDMNVVMCGDGRLVEVQGTAEDEPFTRAQLDQLVDLAAGGIAELVELQREMIAVPPPPRPVASR